MTIELTWPMVSAIFVVLTGMLTGSFYLGDARWVRRTSMHDHVNSETVFRAQVERHQAQVDEKLRSGEQAMARAASEISGLRESVSALKGSVDRLIGLLEGRGAI